MVSFDSRLLVHDCFRTSIYPPYNVSRPTLLYSRYCFHDINDFSFLTNPLICLSVIANILRCVTLNLSSDAFINVSAPYCKDTCIKDFTFQTDTQVAFKNSFVTVRKKKLELVSFVELFFYIIRLTSSSWLLNFGIKPMQNLLLDLFAKVEM